MQCLPGNARKANEDEMNRRQRYDEEDGGGGDLDMRKGRDNKKT